MKIFGKKIPNIISLPKYDVPSQRYYDRHDGYNHQDRSHGRSWYEKDTAYRHKPDHYGYGNGGNRINKRYRDD